MLLGLNKDRFPCFSEEHRKHSNAATKGLKSHTICLSSSRVARKRSCSKDAKHISENKHRCREGCKEKENDLSARKFLEVQEQVTNTGGKVEEAILPAAKNEPG